MRPVIIRNFYPQEVMTLLKSQVAQFKGPEGLDKVKEEREIFFRKEVHNHPLFQTLHLLMTSRARELVGEKVKPSYCFVAMYDEDRSICLPHTDRPQCEYTIDLCIDQGVPWELFINDEPYLMNPGDAVCYSGTKHLHYRNLIRTGNFCDLAFFHFVNEDYSGPLK